MTTFNHYDYDIDWSLYGIYWIENNYYYFNDYYDVYYIFWDWSQFDMTTFNHYDFDIDWSIYGIYWIGDSYFYFDDYSEDTVINGDDNADIIEDEVEEHTGFTSDTTDSTGPAIDMDYGYDVSTSSEVTADSEVVHDFTPEHDLAADDDYTLPPRTVGEDEVIGSTSQTAGEDADCAARHAQFANLPNIDMLKH